MAKRDHPLPCKHAVGPSYWIPNDEVGLHAEVGCDAFGLRHDAMSNGGVAPDHMTVQRDTNLEFSPNQAAIMIG